MENCGGGQRLPPDGDEFPAAYQEFSNSNSTSTNTSTSTSTSGQPAYRYIAAATRTTTITTANGGGLCNENEPFRASETFKMLANDSNVVGSRSIVVLPDGKKVTSIENARQDVNNKIALTNIENVRPEIGKAVPPGSVDNVCQKSSELANDERKPPSYQTLADVAKKNASTVAASSLYPCQMTNSDLTIGEKKMEIAGYHRKDATIVDQAPSHVERDTVLDTPPPLPLTGIFQLPIEADALCPRLSCCFPLPPPPLLGKLSY